MIYFDLGITVQNRDPNSPDEWMSGVVIDVSVRGYVTVLFPTGKTTVWKSNSCREIFPNLH